MQPAEITVQDRLLVLRAQSGDRDAIDQILRAHQQALYRYIRGLVGNQETAEDVLQEVFLIICRNLKHLREPQFLRAWCYRIASRQALRTARRERKRAGFSLDDLELEPEAPITDDPQYPPEWVAALPSLLSQVSPASRAALSLHYLEEMSIRESADVLDLPVGTVKSRIAYGLASIRRLMRSREFANPTPKEVSND